MNDFKVIRLRLTKDNIGKFYFPRDGRAFAKISKDAYRKQIDCLKKRIKESKNPEYDLTVFNYDHYKPHFKITDGCHRTYGLRELFRDEEIDHFDVILLPGTTGNEKDNCIDLTKRLVKMLKKEGLPETIIKQRHVIVDGKKKIIIRPELPESKW